MQKYIAQIAAMPVFAGIAAPKLPALLSASAAVLRELKDGEAVIMQGESNTDVCCVLRGELYGTQVHRDGTATLIAVHSAGTVFGEMLSGAAAPSPVTVAAHGAAAVLCLPFAAIVSGNADPAAKQQLIANLFAETSGKYFELRRRLAVLTARSLRAKIAIWLLGQSRQRSGALSFSCGMTRETLADYLGCERSALSRELSRMCRAGLIDCRRERFTILSAKELEEYGE